MPDQLGEAEIQELGNGFNTSKKILGMKEMRTRRRLRMNSIKNN